MSTKEKLAYTAGIVDGEGCFWRGLCKNGEGRTYYESRLIVVQKEPEMLEWLREQYGGHLRLANRMSYATRRPIWRWSLSGTKCEKFAVLLLPYLIVKRKQVKRVLPAETDYLVKTKVVN
jgi:hypothetical protein